MKTDTFSFSRYKLLFKDYFQMHIRRDGMRLGLVYVLLLLFLVIGGCRGNIEFFLFLLRQVKHPLCLLMAGLVCAEVMQDMRTVSGRAVLVMLPASMWEKFLARFSYIVLLVLAVYTVPIWLATGTIYAIMPYFFSDAFLRLVPFFSFGDESLIERFFLISIPFILSLFLLGGCYFRRHPFGNVLGVLGFGCFVGSVLFVQALRTSMGSALVDSGTFLADSQMHYFLAHYAIYMAVLCFCGGTLLVIYASYRLFARCTLNINK